MASVGSTSRAPRGRPRSRIRAWIAASTAALLLTSSGLVAGGVTAGSRLGNPDVIAHWNLDTLLDYDIHERDLRYSVSTSIDGTDKCESQ